MPAAWRVRGPPRRHARRWPRRSRLSIRAPEQVHIRRRRRTSSLAAAARRTAGSSRHVGSPRGARSRVRESRAVRRPLQCAESRVRSLQHRPLSVPLGVDAHHRILASVERLRRGRCTPWTVAIDSGLAISMTSSSTTSKRRHSSVHAPDLSDGCQRNTSMKRTRRVHTAYASRQPKQMTGPKCCLEFGRLGDRGQRLRTAIFPIVTNLMVLRRLQVSDRRSGN